MKALTAKSRRALLIFLSTLTLALVISATLPSRLVYRSSGQKIVNQVLTKKIADQLVWSTLLVGLTTLVVYNLSLAAFRPWTVAASPRAPPV